MHLASMHGIGTFGLQEATFAGDDVDFMVRLSCRYVDVAPAWFGDMAR